MIDTGWSLYSLLIVTISLIIVYLWYDKRDVSAKEIALIATLAALAGLSRVPFAGIPSVQPTTFLVIITGYVFGAGPGFMVGSLAAFVSNLFLGHGPWTPWQMVGWGLAGICGGLIGRWKPANYKLPLNVLALIWGFLFGWLLNIWHWLTFVYPLTLKSFIAVQLTSVWFDFMHALGNVLFMYFLGPDLIKILNRFKRRLTVSHLPIQEVERS
ncbi:MAG: ECF transporter S component [Bacillota bacterium]